MGFGSFESICKQAALPVCYLLGPPSTLTSTGSPLLLPSCSARSIDVGNTIIFQTATDFTHLGALAMTAIMIFHIRSKFTAVGRREILTFFYIYTVLTIISLILDAGVIPSDNDGPFLWFVAVQNGLVSALCTSLLVNGFVGFQLYEDGTFLSVWLLRASATLMFVISFLLSVLTFKGWSGLSPTNTTGLFVVLYLINAIFLFVYLVMQVILVLNTLQDRWPLWDLVAAVFFFVVGQVLLYAFGARLCDAVSHYLDGLFFATLCNLLAVMMVYKVSADPAQASGFEIRLLTHVVHQYWDSITKEDLEFSVGTRQVNWEATASKEPFTDTMSDLNFRASFYAPANRDSLYETTSHAASSTMARTERYSIHAREQPSYSNLLDIRDVRDPRQGYGDPRKSAAYQVTATAVDDEDERRYSQRERELAY
ncbi:hypothetical protein DV735_g164, partial [Chaetothyriales sp. CBS 134920]